MDDRFMNQLRRDPDPNFTRTLRTRLREQGPASAMPRLRPVPALALAAVAVAVVSLFAFPSVRLSAQNMLDLFRVRKFAAVPFDESRMDRLKQLEPDRVMMVFEQREKLVEAGPPQIVADLGAAAALAGFTPRRATFLPNAITADTVMVEGASAARMAIDESQLRSLLDVLELRDVSIPAGIDGQVVEVRQSPSVIQRFHGGRYRAALVQAKSPELSAPAGLDIERLAEVGLRVLGLDAGEARRVAQGTDWRSTLVVPVPLNASTFRQVTVHGQPGLLITTTGEAGTDRARHRNGSVVLWTEGEQVYGLLCNFGPEDALQMAESVQ